MKRFIAIHIRTMLKRLHIAAHADFYESNIISPLTVLMGGLPMNSGIFNALQIAYQKEDALYKQSLASILTQDLVYLHAKRVALFVYFWDSVYIHRYFDDHALELDAEKLEFLHKNYKSIPQVAYTDASGMLTNFFEDAEKPEWSSLILNLGLTSLLGKAKAANNAFKSIYHERSFDKTQIAQMGKISEIRAEVDETFEALIDSINSAWMANELGAKDPAIRTKLLEVKDHIIAAVHQAEINLARRGAHKVKDDGTTDEGTQAPDTTNPPAPETPPQQPDTTNPPAPETPPQQPDTTIPPINPEDLNPPAAGE